MSIHKFFWVGLKFQCVGQRDFGIRLALSTLDMFVNLSKIRHGSNGIDLSLIKRAVRSPAIIRNYSVCIVFLHAPERCDYKCV